ncbi:OmpA family protein [Pseudomonas stutzeri]|nr:OmpA family protein [Stutzerimonas stutzeri]
MSFVKPAALFVCVALAGCAGKTESTPVAGKAAADKPAAAVVRAEPAKAPAGKVAAADVGQGVAVEAEKGGKGWWPFGGKAKTEKPSGEARSSKPVEVARVSQAWLDEHEKRLREAVAGSKFEVERRGDVLVVVAPVDPSFNKDRPHMLLPVTLGPLSRIAKLVEGDPHNAVLVLGHADSSGDAALNRKLSLERAQAVASIFRMSGFKGDRLVLRGLGADRPRATNDSVSGREQNRRVEMLLTRRDSLSALLAQSER